MASIQIPAASSTVKVSVIDTTTKMIGLPISFFAGPDLKGFETFNGCAFAFLITHTDANGKKRRLVFDLGVPKDWENDLSKSTVDGVKSWGANIEVQKNITEILEDNNVPLDSVEAAVWSHPHFDHVGKISLFPPEVILMTGSGVKKAIYPGYPTVPDSPANEQDLAGRKWEELDFSTSTVTIGNLKAIDYFGDGSFYFLSAPGHAVGHVNGLARTTSDSASGSTFILMGADSFHHSAQLRPSQYNPLPDSIPGPIPNFPQYASFCPGHLFDAIHPSGPHRASQTPAHYKDDMAANHSDPKKTPYFTIASTADGQTLAIDLKEAKQTLKYLQVFDGEDNVLVIAAHDNSLMDVMDYFPAEANDWKAQGWKEKGKWLFLGDFDKALEIAGGNAN